MPATELTVYIVEDSFPVRERLIETVADVPNARVVGQADAITEALEGVQQVQPRVLIVDVQLRRGSGIRLRISLASYYFFPAAVRGMGSVFNWNI